DRPGEPRARVIPGGGTRGATRHPRLRAGALPRARRAPRTGRGLALRGRAADAGAGARPDVAARSPAAGRALAGSRPAHRGADLRGHRPDPRRAAPDDLVGGTTWRRGAPALPSVV